MGLPVVQAEVQNLHFVGKSQLLLQVKNFFQKNRKKGLTKRNRNGKIVKRSRETAKTERSLRGREAAKKLRIERAKDLEN